jgi:PAS domain S-box-containing protein
MKIKVIILMMLLTVSEGICADKLTVALRNDAPPLSFVNIDGQPVGMYVDIWKLWAEKTRQRIEFRAEVLKDTLDSLKNGTADIHGALNYSEERTQWMVFSQPFYEISLCVFFLKNHKKIRNIKELGGYKVGVVTSPHEKSLRKEHPEIEFIPFNAIEEMIQAAREGNIRAFIGTPQFISMTLYRLGLTGEFESTDEMLFAAKVHAGVLKENTELLALIDKGFDAISDKELSEIEARWIPDPGKRYYKSQSKTIRLTAQEQSWIKSHKTIRVGISRTFPPFQFVENNEPVGIVPDYLHLIAERTGIRFELIPVEWNNVDAIAKNRDIDIHLTNDIFRRKEWMNFTAPLFDADFVIVSRNDMPFISHLGSLKGKKAAILRGLPIYEKMKKDYPEIGIYLAKNTAEAIEAVSSGKADVYIGSLIGAAYQIQKYRFPNLKIAGLTDFSHQPMMLAVRNDRDEVVRIINKAILSISKQEHEAIYQKWLPVRFEHTADWSVAIQWISGIGSFFIIILGISLFWNRRLTKEIAERKKAEDSLKESEEQFRAMFENHHAVMLLIEIESGRIIRANKSAEKYYGYTAKEFENLTIHQINQLTEEEIASEMADAYTEKRNYFHFPHRLASGEIRDVEVHSSPIPFKRKNILFSIIHDITDRKSLEKAFQENHANLLSVLENTDDIICSRDQDGRLIFYNNALAEIVRKLFDAEPFKGMKTLDYLPEEVQTFWKSILNRVLSGERYKGEFTWNFRDGDVRHYEISYNPIWKDDRVIGCSEFNRDITERKRAEITMREQKERLNAILDATIANICVVDRQFNLVEYNKAFASVFDLTRDDLGKNILELFSEEVRKQLKDWIEKVFFTGIPKRIESQRGSSWVDAILYPVCDDAGNITEVAIYAMDITERKQFEEKRLELERQVLNVQKMESLGRISAGIAHNFNNILYAVMGNIEIAMDDIPPESPTCRILEEALSAAERAARLTHKILAYSGSGFFTFREIDISRLIKENAPKFKSAMPENISFSLNLTEDIPLINADPEQIQRVITNILINASEAIGENTGTVILSTGVSNCDDISSSGFRRIDDPEEKTVTGRCVYIEISDTGCGMSEETIKLLTDPFFTTKFMGRGLGMSEVQGIVRNHNGGILVKSEPGQGTTIRVLFPVS